MTSDKRKTVLRIASLGLYAVGFACLGVYIALSFSTGITIPPSSRLFILGVVCVAVYAASRLYCSTTDEAAAQRIMKATFGLFFVLYIFLLVTLVLFDSYFGRTGFASLEPFDSPERQAYIRETMNLVPFDTVWCFVSGIATGEVTPLGFVINIFGNLLAFAPFAFFLPLLWKAQRRTWVFLVTMVCIVTAVEVSQLILLTGFCDIDDLILNTGGAWILYAILRVKSVAKLIEKFTKTL